MAEQRKIKRIIYPTRLSCISDKHNDNIDVIIEFSDGQSMAVVVSTPRNLIWQMETSGLQYLPLGEAQIIVSKLDKDIIESAIYEYAKDEELFTRLFLS